MTLQEAERIVFGIYALIEQDRYGFNAGFTNSERAILELSVHDDRPLVARKILNHYGVPEHLDVKQGLALLQLIE